MKAISEIGVEEGVISRIREIFRAHEEVEEVVLYGSRAMGNYKPFSDFDLTMKGSKLTLTIQQKIESELEELMLPYTFDLSIFHKISNQDLIDHITRVGKKFY